MLPDAQSTTYSLPVHEKIRERNGETASQGNYKYEDVQVWGVLDSAACHSKRKMWFPMRTQRRSQRKWFALTPLAPARVHLCVLQKMRNPVGHLDWRPVHESCCAYAPPSPISGLLIFLGGFRRRRRSVMKGEISSLTNMAVCGEARCSPFFCSRRGKRNRSWAIGFW